MQNIPDDQKVAELTTLLVDKKFYDVEAMLQASEQKNRLYELIMRAVRSRFGEDYVYTVHGVLPRLDKRFDNRLHGVFQALGSFQSQLLSQMGIESFLTSGTLLGLVRDGSIIPHDDDFDACYVSRETDKAAIVKERAAIRDWIDRETEFTANDATGGHFHVFHKTYPQLPLMFDLFTGWIEGEFFNEYPLAPNTLKAEDVTPVRSERFYDATVFVPSNPESLLAVNYGPDWRVPDPTWRFDWHETSKFYTFLTSQHIPK